MRKVLIIAIVVLALILTGLVGYIAYDMTHFTVEGDSYAKYAKELDLREKEISIDHYLAVRSQLPNCIILWNVPLQDSRYSCDSRQLEIKSLTAEDIEVLANYFPDLKVVEAYECQNYALLEELVSRLNGVEVNYKVDMGGTTQLHWTTADTSFLDPSAYSFDALMENLKHMPLLTRIGFMNAELTAEEMTQLQEAYPNIEMSFSAEILGKEYDMHTTSLDLSDLTSDQVDEVAGKLGALVSLETVELMQPSGTTRLGLADVKKLVDAAPNVKFHYIFDFYGITVDTTQEEVTIKNIKVEDDNFEQNLRMALDVMSGCKRFVLDGKGQYDKMWQKISDEALAKIREDYRDKLHFVWRVYFGENGASLTDAQVLRAVYGLTDDNSKDLIYCENVRYLDLGHNEYLDYMDFLSGMKELEVAILSGAPLKSLDPIAACKNLKFLEIANCMYLPDINALKECKELEMLNISFTTFEDMSVVNDLNLTHLTVVKSKIADEVIEQYIEEHPDCWTVYEGSQPYGIGWRYAENGQGHLDWYAKMVTAFKYPNPYNNVGWYLD